MSATDDLVEYPVGDHTHPGPDPTFPQAAGAHRHGPFDPPHSHPIPDPEVEVDVVWPPLPAG